MKNKRYYTKCILLFILFIVLTCAYSNPLPVYANNEGEVNVQDENIEDRIIDEQIEMDEIGSIEKELQKYKDENIDEIMPGYDPEKIIRDVAKGRFEFDVPNTANRILGYLFEEIYLNMDILIKLIVLVALCAVLNNLQTSFLNKGVGELAFYVCYIVLVSILLISFSSVVKAGTEIIDRMVNFMYSSIPVLITLIISSGNISSGGVLQPVLIMIVQVSATIIKNLLIPLIILSTVISIVDNISDKVQISRLAGFLKHVTQWTLGLILTLFVAIVSIQGSLGAVVDGVTSKTAKFAISAFIPVAGKYLADAADAVIGCTLLIKNAVGVAIMIGIIVICLLPLVKMLAIILLYRMTCVLLEPLAEGRIIKCISDVTNSMTYILGIAASVAFMFLITVTALILASNISTMIR
ncbi:stage III sporulation protein AE [Acetivibrio mesophilus]|uniref:Stage III sporulation protein AE n=1 Tax=Acetivibrio mesophilus TaxID=2487273 RepID=A0A4Q0I5U6_9FIRM|nr:stage III sporulation protein AE [Acetivibrio mesophilus]RXE59680.1 stage III sporulation protein AE [Acetivibrio mesophilus]